MRLPDGGEGFTIWRDASGLSLPPPAVIRLSHTGEYRYMVPENTQGRIVAIVKDDADIRNLHESALTRRD